ncbi:zinc-dependent metalloprotease [Dermabacteraceae bacterium P13077]
MTNSAHGKPGDDPMREFLENLLGSPLPDGFDASALSQAGLPNDPNQLRAAAEQLKRMLSATSGKPVNWDLARQLARQTSAGQIPLPGMPAPSGTDGDPRPTDAEKTQLREAARLASLWLSAATEFTVSTLEPDVYTRALWVEKTLPRWQRTVEPAAEHTAKALGDAFASQGPAGAAFPGVGNMFSSLGGTMFGMQFGAAIGALSREAFGATDLGLPLIESDRGVLVARNIEDFVAEADLDPAAARIFLAAREIAHCTLFSNSPWIAEYLFGAIEEYARGIQVDIGHLEEMAREHFEGMDMSNPDALSGGIPEGMLEFTRTPAQERALEQISWLLALIEGWVDHVVTTALTSTLPRLEAMREMNTRRRAVGSPAEQMLARLVGIELRPRRIREATAWWESVTATEGPQGRDRVWDHPDLLPTPDVLAGTPQPPAKPVPNQLSPEDFDNELEKLLRGEGAENAPREDEQGGVSEA